MGSPCVARESHFQVSPNEENKQRPATVVVLRKPYWPHANQSAGVRTDVSSVSRCCYSTYGSALRTGAYTFTLTETGWKRQNGEGIKVATHSRIYFVVDWNRLLHRLGYYSCDSVQLRR